MGVVMVSHRLQDIMSTCDGWWSWKRGDSKNRNTQEIMRSGQELIELGLHLRRLIWCCMSLKMFSVPDTAVGTGRGGG